MSLTTAVARHWLFSMMQSLKSTEFTTLVVTMWAIWFARRKVIHEDILQSPMATHLFIQSFLHELGMGSGGTEKKTPRGLPKGKTPRWLAPPAGACKLNADGAVAKTANRGAVGVVCRTYEGVYLGASVVVFEGVTHPGCLEAMACREALALMEDLNVGRLMVASDCLKVVQGLQHNNLGQFSHILREIKSAASARGGISFRHENRKLNTEAHRLARVGTFLPVGRHVWLGSMPEGLNLTVNITTIQ
jgi:ribonuclease HI